MVQKIYANNPSQVFDDDFNYGTMYNIWSRFQEGTFDTLEVRGIQKSTFISYFEVLNPRLDIAKNFYK